MAIVLAVGFVCRCLEHIEMLADLLDLFSTIFFFLILSLQRSELVLDISDLFLGIGETFRGSILLALRVMVHE